MGSGGCLVVQSQSPCTTTVLDAVGTCAAGACGFACNTGYAASGNSCQALPPQQIAPLSSKIVTTRTPTLSWVLPAGIAQAYVEVCTDRACDNVVWDQTVTGTSVAVGTALPVGVAYWNVYGVGSQGPGITPSPTWQLSVPNVGGNPLSTSWGTVHDFDGDGYGDLTLQYGVPGNGGSEVYYGSSSGISAASATITFAGFGRPVSLGDVNGDGFADFGGTDNNSSSDLGLEVYFGGASGLSANPSQTLGLLADGYVVAVGDVNGDGYADAAVCSSQGSASILVFFGSPAGLPATPDVTIPAPAGDGNICNNPELDMSGDELALDGGGDINGDGYDDIIAGDRAAGAADGQVYVFFGGPDGPSTTPSQTIDSPAPGDANEFGALTVMAGDLNGDGYADVVVTNSESQDTAGTPPYPYNPIYVYYGSAGGLPASPSATLPAAPPNSLFGAEIGAAGDVNGDGYCDFVVGLYSYSPPDAAETGAFSLYLGGATGVATSPSITVVAPGGGYYFGGAAAGIGDVNGDGLFDIAAGGVSQGLQSGFTAVYLGSTANPPISTTPSSTLSLGTWISSLTGG